MKIDLPYASGRDFRVYLSDAFVRELESIHSEVIKHLQYNPDEEESGNVLSNYRLLRQMFLHNQVISDVGSKALVDICNVVPTEIPTLRQNLYKLLIKNEKYQIRSSFRFQSASTGNFSYEQFVNDSKDALYCLYEESDVFRTLGQWRIDSQNIQNQGLKKECFITVSPNMNELKEVAHYFNRLVIFDPYIFFNSRGQNKVNNLFGAIKALRLPELNTGTLLVDIFADGSPDGIRRYQFASQDILMNLNGKKMIFNIHLINDYRENIGKLSSDRHWLTNYMYLSLTHPLDRESNVTAIFLPLFPDRSMTNELLTAAEQVIGTDFCITQVIMPV